MEVGLRHVEWLMQAREDPLDSVMRPHSLLVQMALEAGYVGVALLVIAFGGLLVQSWRSRRGPGTPMSR